MRVRMLATMAGPGGVVRQGEVVAMDEVTGRMLVGRGYAEVVDASRISPQTADEASAAEQVERAVGKPQRPPSGSPRKRARRKKTSDE